MKLLKPRSHLPFNHQIDGINLIVYPLLKQTCDLHDIAANIDSLKKRLDILYSQNKENLHRGLYHIVFVWAWNEYFMSDIWIHQKNLIQDLDFSGEILLENILCFKDNKSYNFAGLATENTLIFLGREHEHRLKFENLQDYLDRTKSLPDFPVNIVPNEEY